jgi:hypothetical protein
MTAGMLTLSRLRMLYTAAAAAAAHCCFILQDKLTSKRHTCKSAEQIPLNGWNSCSCELRDACTPLLCSLAAGSADLALRVRC